MIQKEKLKKTRYPATKIFHMYSVSSTGYYNWLATYEDHSGKRQAQEIEKNELKEHLRTIIRKLGFVPGKRTFRLYLWRDHGIHMGVEQIRKIMKSMNLLANRPKKDAYKGKATHFHEFAAKQNHVSQQFKIRPRMIILTDITYLYYGPQRTLCYLCVFKDAYTAEILGYAVRSDMSVTLIREAYDMMIAHHGEELKEPSVYLHSDQGSQYLSTKFQQLLSDDGFIQSMSARGNSQDNAPMESFFGRLKTEIIDIIARCPNIAIVKKLILGYMDSYNHIRYQYGLAGLTPVEYYEYCISGVYPLDNYFGVKDTELISVKQLIAAKVEKEKKHSVKVREGREAKAKETVLSAVSILARDQKKIKTEIRKWERSETIASQQLKKLRELYEKTKEAVEFYSRADKETLESLKDPQNWKKYKEFNYVNELGALY